MTSVAANALEAVDHVLYALDVGPSAKVVEICLGVSGGQLRRKTIGDLIIPKDFNLVHGGRSDHRSAVLR